jgi:hypothetical protein
MASPSHGVAGLVKGGSEPPGATRRRPKGGEHGEDGENRTLARPSTMAPFRHPRRRRTNRQPGNPRKDREEGWAMIRFSRIEAARLRFEFPFILDTTGAAPRLGAGPPKAVRKGVGSMPACGPLGPLRFCERSEPQNGLPRSDSVFSSIGKELGWVKKLSPTLRFFVLCSLFFVRGRASH